jgi:3-oxoadipate enol-lactonase
VPYTLNHRVRIYWEEEGQGEPLLMIMGLGFPLAMWGDLRPFMARRFRTIVFDNRGVGKSDAPLPPYSIAKMAQDAICVLEAAQAPRANILGLSMGGMIAQEVVLSAPHRVHKLILGCTNCGGRRSVHAAPEVHHALLPRFFVPREKRIAAVLPFIYDEHTPRNRVEADVEILRRCATPVLGFIAQLLAIIAWQSYDRLSHITAPTLVIHGETDRLVPPGNAKILADRIPNAKLVMLPHASHIFPTDQPERTREELLAFLTGASSAQI